MNTLPPDSVRRALQALEEGHPDGNEPRRTGTGELDNGAARHLLAGAAFTVVLHRAPREAFDDLAHHLDEAGARGWFGTKRAELILEMLLYQAGWTEDSTWNSVREAALRRLGTRPDQRWGEACSHLPDDGSRLGSLAAELRRRLSGDGRGGP